MVAKTLLTFSLLLVSFSLLAKIAKKVPTGVNAKYIYSELYPSENLNYNFEWIVGCKADKLNVEKFESFKEYPDVDGKSTQKVRTLHLYVNGISPCSQIPRFTKKQSLKISGDPKLMTHIYLVVNDGIKLKP